MFDWILNMLLLPVKNKEKNLLKTLTFTTPFNGWGLTISSPQNHCEETVYYLPLSPQESLVPI